jgi:hypothetical protein
MFTMLLFVALVIMTVESFLLAGLTVAGIHREGGRISGKQFDRLVVAFCVDAALWSAVLAVAFVG